jgi:hypothetical protein
MEDIATRENFVAGLLQIAFKADTRTRIGQHFSVQTATSLNDYPIVFQCPECSHWNFCLLHDTVSATITPLMKSSEDKDIDSATDLEVAYKKLCVAGKASINSKIGYAQAKSDFARQLYQVITDKRSGNYMNTQVASTQAKICAQRQTFLEWGVPGAISLQSNLLDRLASICSQFYYTEAMECSVVSDATLQAFSLEKMDDFVAAVLKGAEALEDSAPLSRQAWTIVDQPLTISISDLVGGGKQLIESFRTSNTTTIPANVFEAIPRLKYLSAVCMLSASVEIVGAKPSASGNAEVEVFIGSMGSPAMQRTQSGDIINFKTPSMQVKSSYSMNMVAQRDNMVDMPFWGVEGKLYDSESRFCRTSFQDMILSVGKTSEGLDWSQVTAIKLYLYGNANTAQANDDLGPTYLNGVPQKVWDGAPRSILSVDYIPPRMWL